ncbi:MAG: hypothetical protein ACM3KR_10285 [Deltaproteobacteria bacterium]
MQEAINKILAEVKRVIQRPPSRPIRLMLFDTASLCGYAQNKVKELFGGNEVININSFFESDTYRTYADVLAVLESEVGMANTKFQRKLCDALEEFIINYIKLNRAKKILIIEDSELFNYEFNPIHFLSAYMFDNSEIVDNELPLIWLTVGQKDDYATSEYRYYKTENTSGRLIKLTQETFRSCVLEFKEDY